MSGTRRHLILLRELFPFTFVVVLWFLQLWQGFFQQDFSDYSLFPRTITGLLGIITAPLLHADFSHLVGNTVPLLILGLLLYSSYREIAGTVFWTVYITNGILLWLFAREAFHLGASGVVYGLAFFLFLSGFIRKIPHLTMLSFLLIFLYGSMVWGVFPFDPQVSWEAHLYGALSGIVLAFILRKKGPQPVKYWEEEEDVTDGNNVTDVTNGNDVTDGNPLGTGTAKPESHSVKINYEYKPKEPD